LIFRSRISFVEEEELNEQEEENEAEEK